MNDEQRGSLRSTDRGLPRFMFSFVLFGRQLRYD